MNRSENIQDVCLRGFAQNWMREVGEGGMKNPSRFFGLSIWGMVMPFIEI